MEALSEIPSFIEMNEEIFENNLSNGSDSVNIYQNPKNLSGVKFYTGDPELGTLKELFTT